MSRHWYCWPQVRQEDLCQISDLIISHCSAASNLKYGLKLSNSKVDLVKSILSCLIDCWNLLGSWQYRAKQFLIRCVLRYWLEKYMINISIYKDLRTGIDEQHVLWISARFLYRPALTGVHSFGNTTGLFGCMNAFRFVYYDNPGLASWLQSLSVSWECWVLHPEGCLRSAISEMIKRFARQLLARCGLFKVEGSLFLLLLFFLFFLFFFFSFYPFLSHAQGKAETDGFVSSDRHLLSSPRIFWTFCTAGTCDDFSCEHNIPVVTQYTQETN